MQLLKKGLTNNQLKIIAMIAMVADHTGKELLPQLEFLQIIGRLAFPIFAYMIAEGCMYTKNKKSYLIKIGVLALICQTVYFIAMNSWYMNVLITFVLSIIMIFSIDRFIKKKNFSSGILALLSTALAVFLCFFTDDIFKGSGFHIDYGFFGVLLPVAVYFAKGKTMKICATAAMLTALGFSLGGVQWYSFAVIPILILYNGKRGKLNLKYLFYIFYPAHLAVIHLIDLLIKAIK